MTRLPTNHCNRQRGRASLRTTNTARAKPSKSSAQSSSLLLRSFCSARISFRDRNSLPDQKIGNEGQKATTKLYRASGFRQRPGRRAQAAMVTREPLRTNKRRYTLREERRETQRHHRSRSGGGRKT